MREDARRNFSEFGDTQWGTPRHAPRPSVAGTGKRPAAAKSNAAGLFARGDMVQHTAFGRGMVLSVLPMGNDALIEIAFDEIGTKRLMANAAAPHMKKQS